MEEIRNPGTSNKPTPNSLKLAYQTVLMIRNHYSLWSGHKASKISIIFVSQQQIFPLCIAYTNQNCYIIVKRNYFLLKMWWCPHMSIPLLGRERTAWSIRNYMFHTALLVLRLRYEMDNLQIVGKFLTIERNSSRPALGPTQPPSQQIQEPLSPGVTQLEHDSDRSLPFSSQNWWSWTSIPPYALAWCVM